MSIFTQKDKTGQVVENPIAAKRDGENITVEAVTVLLVLDKKKGCYNIAKENAKQADAQLTLFPGAQVYTNETGISIGNVAKNAKNGKVPENNPSLWTVGYWLLVTKVEIGGLSGYDIFFGRIGERTSVTGGLLGFDVKPPQNARRFERGVTDAIAPVVAQLWGHCSAEGTITQEMGEMNAVIDGLRSLGTKSPDLAFMASFRNTISTTSDGPVTNRLQATIGGKAVERKERTVGAGAQTNDDVKDTLAELNAIAGGITA